MSKEVSRLKKCGAIVLLSLFTLVCLAVFSGVAWAGNEGCFACHNQPGFKKLIAGETVSLYVDPDRYEESVHGEVDCIKCHLGFGLMPHEESQAKDYAKVASMACRYCHDEAYREFSKSPHGKAVEEGGSEAPTCAACHGSHYIKKLETPLPVEEKFEMTEKCGECHEEAWELIQPNYHYRALKLGHKKSAGCADCHGAHDIKALELGSEETVEACGQCHEGANEKMAHWLIHVEPAHKEAPLLLHYLYLFFVCLTIAVLAIFYLHTILWFIRRLIDRSWRHH